MIVVTGATGHLGSATIDFLLRKGVPAHEIAVLARSADKAQPLAARGVEVRTGDYNDYGSLVKAFTGADKLLLVSSNDISQRSQQQANAVNAAKEAGVKHLIYTSFDRKDETDHSPIAFVAKAHLETEQAIRASGIPYTIMRNTLYADILPMFWGDQVLSTGIFIPAGQGKAAFTTRQDMAEAAAVLLTTLGHEGKEYLIAGSERYSQADAAEALSRASGKPVVYHNPTPEAFQSALTAAGVPAEAVGMVQGFAQAINQGEFEATGTDLEKLLGRKPTTLEGYLRSVYSAN
ncbi:MAG: SDR family oxidoreductase [Bacteroidetes bacterium]|nr:SDR family oxidoreductase [Bacteroidota bacterium]